MRLPNGDQAFVDIGKLRNYCLSTESEEGKHKARVFFAVFGLSADDSEELQVALLAAARNDDAIDMGTTPFGQRFTIDFKLTRQGKTGIIRSGWMVRTGEDFLRLTTCYVDI